MRDELELTLFGTPEVRLQSRLVTGFRSSKAQALLYYLAVTGRPQARATLGGLLWGDQPEAAARPSLSKCLSNLHELLGDAVLIERQTVAFNRAHPYQLDTERFAAHAGTRPTPATIQSLQAALAVYRGDFLEGFYVRDAPDFEQWVLHQRADYREAAVNGLHTLATYAEQQGDLPQAVVHTRRLLALEPWREEAHRHLMKVLARSGQRAAALAQFETCRRVLNDELAVEPDAETLTLVEAIRAGDFDTVTGWQGDKVNGTQDRPVTLSPPQHVTFPLPIPPTPLIGREQELAELGELLGAPHCRLVTITGPGGIGKTRLALAVAADQSGNFAQGALFVPLAGVSTAQFLPQAILATLNLPAPGDLSPQEQLRFLLYKQECLLVLDNYEHLLPEIDLLVEILSYAPQVTLLVTSRERLALQSEHLRELAGLSYPPTQPARSGAPTLPWSSYAALRLFLQRARQTQPRFTPNEEEMAAIVRICQIGEGMPLALELAAAVVREQSCIELATALELGQASLAVSLRDLPERHRTIKAVFAQSWRLLSAAEQKAFRSLSAFRGGFGVEAAQEVSCASRSILAALVDKSLLRRNEVGRYELHELLRQYAAEQLALSGELDEIQQSYTDYFLRLSEAAETGMDGPQQIGWMTRMEQEIDNLRATLKWLTQHAPEEGLRMTHNLFRLWQASGYLQEGQDWFAVALTHAEKVSSLVRANSLCDAGFLAICSNKIEAAEDLFAQSLALYQQLDLSDPQVAEGLASVLSCQSLGPLFRGDYDQTLRLCSQGMEIARRIGSKWRVSRALFFAGEALYHQGLFAQSKSSYEESLNLCEAIGNLRSNGRRYVRLGHVACAQGEHAQAEAWFKKGLLVANECQDWPGLSLAFVGLARIAAISEDYRRATLLLAAKEKTADVNPFVRHWPMDRKESERTLVTLHAHVDETTFATAWDAGCAMSLEQAVTYALADSAPQ